MAETMLSIFNFSGFLPRIVLENEFLSEFMFFGNALIFLLRCWETMTGFGELAQEVPTKARLYLRGLTNYQV